jgi:hypothetical protein
MVIEQLLDALAPAGHELQRRTYQRANRDVLIEGDLLPVGLRRSGTVKGRR